MFQKPSRCQLGQQAVSPISCDKSEKPCRVVRPSAPFTDSLAKCCAQLDRVQHWSRFLTGRGHNRVKCIARNYLSLRNIRLQIKMGSKNDTVFVHSCVKQLIAASNLLLPQTQTNSGQLAGRGCVCGADFKRERTVVVLFKYYRRFSKSRAGQNMTTYSYVLALPQPGQNMTTYG